MTKKILFFFLIIILLNFQNIFAKVENNIVLKVENEIITNFEIKNKIIATLILANQEINQSNINKLKKQALDFLIKQKLKKIELSKYNLKVDQQKITSYLNSISSNNINGLKEKFSISGIDFQLFYEELEIDFLWQKYIYQVYSKKIEIDEKNINQELENLLKNQTDIEQFRISEIDSPYPCNDKALQPLFIYFVLTGIKFNDDKKSTLSDISTSGCFSNNLFILEI